MCPSLEIVLMNKWIKIDNPSAIKDGRYIVYVPYNTCPWIGVSSLRDGKFDDGLATHYMKLPEPPNE
jgi:hypothetical protein